MKWHGLDRRTLLAVELAAIEAGPEGLDYMREAWEGFKPYQLSRCLAALIDADTLRLPHGTSRAIHRLFLS